jgi:hypothetical protein
VFPCNVAFIVSAHPAHFLSTGLLIFMSRAFNVQRVCVLLTHGLFGIKLTVFLNFVLIISVVVDVFKRFFLEHWF